MLARQCYHILTVLICSLYALDKIRSFHIYVNLCSFESVEYMLALNFFLVKLFSIHKDYFEEVIKVNFHISQMILI